MKIKHDLGIIFSAILSLLLLAPLKGISQDAYSFVLKWGVPGQGEGEFHHPIEVAVDNLGSIYVVDGYNYRIQKFTTDGDFITKWGEFGYGDGQFYDPRAVAVDQAGFVYVADAMNHRIQIFTPEGYFVDKWGEYGTGEGQFSYPAGIAFDNDGNIYIGDTSNHRIQKFDSNHHFITAWGSYGSEAGKFKYPYRVAVDKAGFVYVSDCYNWRVQKFTTDGNFLTMWGEYGNGPGEFMYSYGIEVDDSGYVFVTSELANQVQKFTPNGEFVTMWGSQGTGDGQFNYCQGIAVDKAGFVYVVDVDNHRVQKFAVPQTETLFLHGLAPTLILGNNSPVSTTALYKDSPSVNRTAYKEIGTWSVTNRTFTLETIGPLHVWVGLKNSDDQGTYFDLKAEILKNGRVVASGTTFNIEGITRNPSLAKEVFVSFSDMGSSIVYESSDVFAVRILTKVTAEGGHSSAVGLRLYYDSVNRASGFSIRSLY